ncbi:MAG: hypothetical protein P1V36_12685, partial [Planctomycetota bacterium]|nr:hypothetical protein [Planctomycetota bacterium]
MRSRCSFADSLAPGTALRRVIGLLLMACITCGVVAAGPAHAEGRNMTAAQMAAYREALLKAESERDVGAVLMRLREISRDTHPLVYGKIVGPILQDTKLTAEFTPERRRMLLGELVIHMIAVQPDSDAILFLNDILARLGEDPGLVDRINEVYKPDPVTTRRPGWDRLLRAARGLIRSADGVTRAGAIRLVAHCKCEDTAVVVAALHDALRSGERKPTAEDEVAYLDAAERLLLFRFADLSALVSFLNPIAAEHFGTPESREAWTATDRERIRAELYRALILRLREEGGSQSAKEHQAALDYGRAVIEKAKGPGDLLVFFDPKRQRLPELQQEAMQAAERLEPKPTQAWADLLVAAIDQSDHMGVLESIVPVLTKTFTAPSGATQLLAASVARRLADGAESDRVDLRETLATVLGRIGTAKDVRDALEGRARIAEDRQKAVWSELIHALGTVQDGQVLWLRPHYLPPASRPDWERLAVAETLGQQGFRSADGKAPNLESPQAALFLLHILHGWSGTVVSAEVEVKTGEETKKVRVARIFVNDGETNELESEEAKEALAAGDAKLSFDAANPDAADAVREAAANSLLFHAGPHAASALGRAASEDNDVGNAALRVLGLQLGRGSGDAARALAHFIESAPPEGRLLAALDVITRTGAPKTTVARMTLGKAVTDLLAKGGSEAVVRSAAAAGAHLQQLAALKPVYLAWHGQAPDNTEARAVWLGLLRGVVAGVAKAGATPTKLDPDFDLKFETEVKGLVGIGAGHEENAGTFATILGGLGDLGERFALKRLRAELATQYVGVQKGRTLDQRRAELDGVIGLYRELAGEAPSAGEKREMQRMLYDALHSRWTKWLRTGEGGEDAAPLQLAALQAAVD